MSTERIIRTITVTSEGCQLEYLEPKRDIRENGLMVNHIVYVPGGEDYDESLEALIVAAQRLLSDVLEDLEIMPAVDLEQMALDLQERKDDEDEPDFDARNYPPKE